MASVPPHDEWYVYILLCSDGTYYTGATVDVERRVERHNSGRGAKYTRSRIPVTLHHREGPMTRSDALRREVEIKRMKRSVKEMMGAEGR